MSLDQATQDFLAQMAEQGGPQLHEMSPEQAREMVGELANLYGDGPRMARVEDVDIDSADGSFDARVFVPEGDVRGVFIYYHGGGWVLGDIEGHDTLARNLAERTKCTVVLPHYRLAPEYTYPTAVEDAYATLEWAAENRGRFAAAGVPMIIGGDSAGGNLAAVTALRARDRNGPDIAFQALVYPVTDANLETNSYLAEENQLFLNRDGMAWFWDHYVPNDDERDHQDASPLRADNFENLPPALVLTAEYDVLRDEGEAYAQSLIEAGVPTEFHRMEGQMHGFFTMVNLLPGHDRGMNLVVEAVDKTLR